jgi:hypothetical protein
MTGSQTLTPDGGYPEGPFANARFSEMRRGERVISASGTAGFLVLAAVVYIEGLPPWEFALMIVFAAVVPLWILVIRSGGKPPVSFRFGSVGLRLEFRERGTTETRDFPWNAVFMVLKPRRKPTVYWLCLPLKPGQQMRERAFEGRIERFSWPDCEVAVDAAVWPKIADKVPADAKGRLS